MLTRLILLTCGLMGMTVLLAGAWPGPFAETPQDPSVRFLAQPVPLDPAIVGSGVEAAQLIQMAIGKLENVAWLKTKIRQTMNYPNYTCIAEGCLQRGPNQCARLHMTSSATRLTIISDGDVSALTAEGAAPDVAALPPRSASRSEREAFLSSRGLGGPLTLLRQIAPLLGDATLQTGMLGDVGVIRIAFAGSSGERRGALYLDAKTLWPCRIDWCDAECGRLVLRMEFFDQEIDREMSLDECMQAFSYQ